MLVLTRLGKSVVIKNYKNSELWTPFFDADKQYGNKEVFKIKIKKHIFTSVPDSHLTFEISDISGSEWECLKPFFLRFSGVTESFKCNDGEVLFDKEYRGKIFVNEYIMRKTCHGCEHLKAKSFSPFGVIMYCGSTEDVVPHNGNKLEDGKNWELTFWRVPMSCPPPDDQVKKSEHKAPQSD